mgnify:CR=1 FL=1
MATTIEAKYRIVTPLFCAGADPDRAELRLPSFKGVLRFWWRALAWSRCRGNLGEIKRQEDALFGSTGTGQSRVLIRLDLPSGLQQIRPPTLLQASAGRVVGEGARYLGYGVIEAFGRKPRDARPETKAGQLTRACLRAPLEFTFRLRTRDLAPNSLDSLTNALIAMGTFGGLGAKSRKGYGSLVLRSVRINGAAKWSAPGTLDELNAAIAAFYSGGMSDDFPEFTALSKRTRHVLLCADTKEPLEILDLVGREIVRFRSWGRNGKILGGSIDSEKLFRDDHDLMKAPCDSRTAHPRRIAFGLPHNYGKPKDQQVGPHDAHLDRRASPLFIHIHECGETPVAVLSFLPARFLPKGNSDVSVGGKRVSQAPENELYRPIHAFLDRLLDANQRKEPFTSAVEVKP